MPSHSADPAARTTKGARTTERLLDAAERLFAERGYDGTSLREIAREVGIREPGIYNHFEGKQALYAAVLERALTPMLGAIAEAMESGAYRALPAMVMDQLAAHPSIASLFHRALLHEGPSSAETLVDGWLARLFGEGLAALDRAAGSESQRDRSGRAKATRTDLAIRVIAMFHLTTGYFVSQKAFETLTDSREDLCAPENLRLQKELLDRLAGALLDA